MAMPVLTDEIKYPFMRRLPGTGRMVLDTGKLYVGERYEPPQRDQGVHADWTQSVLLERRHTFNEPRARMPWLDRLCWVAALALLFGLPACIRMGGAPW
jgi:hypothetical protein